jgi:hypothetical protein
MRETRTYGSEGGGTELNRFSRPLSFWSAPTRWPKLPLDSRSAIAYKRRVQHSVAL